VLWQPGWQYTDRRALGVPCDVPPGEYNLLLGVYDVQQVANLPVTLFDGTPVGDLLYLTTLVVQ
jgi:hypothetical protein